MEINTYDNLTFDDYLHHCADKSSFGPRNRKLLTATVFEQNKELYSFGQKIYDSKVNSKCASMQMSLYTMLSKERPFPFTFHLPRARPVFNLFSENGIYN
jgi:hypothetical protein